MLTALLRGDCSPAQPKIGCRRWFEVVSLAVDYPGCNCWIELADYYRGAKVILTSRDASKWFAATNETIHSVDFARFMKNAPFGEMIQKTMWDRMENRVQDREHMVEFSNEGSAEIIDSIAAAWLLDYQVSAGWEPLCEYLDVLVPDLKFPRSNSRNETKELPASLMAVSGEQLGKEAMAKAAHELQGDWGNGASAQLSNPFYKGCGRRIWRYKVIVAGSGRTGFGRHHRLGRRDTCE
jgi:Sulfotransferase domain